MLLTDGDELKEEHFPMLRRQEPGLSAAVGLPADGINLEALERSLVVQALERSGWNQTKAADAARPQPRSDPLPHREVQARAKPLVASLRSSAGVWPGSRR